LSADLVVLSACDTGNGALQSGEGVMSLARSLSYAGCASSMVSLWSIDDCATSKITQTYYEHLAKNKSKDFALGKAKLEYINNTTDKLQAHPYYWAGLIQTGNVTPITLNESSFKNNVGIMVALIILTFIWALFKWRK